MGIFLLAVIYIAFISLGLPDSLLGSGWSAMHSDVGASVSAMGVITMVISGCTIISSLFSDRLTKKFGTRVVTVVSIFLTAIALIGFCFSHKFWQLIIFSVPYGLGAGAIDAALNNYVSLHYASRHMNWLHCFWGIGAIISPFIMGYALTDLSWRGGYFIVACIQFAIGLFILFTLPVWKVNALKVAECGSRTGILDVLKVKGVPFILLGFFAYCAAEATTMQWASIYFVQTKGVSVDTAAMLGSLFYAGITLGRFLSGFISDRLGDKKMIVLGTCILFLGIILLAIPIKTPALAIAGFVVIGFGCAPIYPCIIHSAPGNFGKEISGAIIGIQMACAYVGSTFMPPLYGLIGGFVGFGFLPLFLALFFALMIAMTLLSFKMASSNRLSAN